MDPNENQVVDEVAAEVVETTTEETTENNAPAEEAQASENESDEQA